MKKTLILSALAAAAMAVSCNKTIEVATPGLVHFKLTAQTPQTKTSIVDMGEGGYMPVWHENDKIGILFSIPEGLQETKELRNDAVFVADASEDGSTAEFSGVAEVDDSEAQTIYAYYPSTAGQKIYRNGSIGLDIPAEQHPIFVRDNYSFDPASDLLVAKPHTCFVVDREAVSNDDMLFTRVSCVVKFAFNAESGSKAYLQHVKSVKLTTEGAHISARVAVDPKTCQVTACNSKTGSTTVTLLPTDDCYAMVGADGGNCLFASVAPVTVKENARIVIEVETDKYTITKTLDTHAAIEFPVGGIFVFNLNISDDECISNEGGGTTQDADVLDLAASGVTSGSTTYSSWTYDKAPSGAVYAGNSAGGNSSIQLRSSNNSAGIVTTKSAGGVKKVSVVWNESTASGRVLNIYGKNDVYTSPSDLYNTTTAGTLLGTITCSTGTKTNEYVINGNYAYVGLRSASGAMYLQSVSVEWGELGEVVEKKEQTLSFPQSSYDVELGSTFTAPTLSGLMSSVQYESSNPNAAVVDAETGAVTLKGVGTTVITATAAENDEYQAAEAKYTLNVKAPAGTSVTETLSGELILKDGTLVFTSDSGIVLTQKQGTGTSAVNSTYNEISTMRVYKGHILNFSSSTKIITKIEITVNARYYGNNLNASVGKLTGTEESGGTIIWEGESRNIDITNVADKSNVQIRPSSIKVTYK